MRYSGIVGVAKLMRAAALCALAVSPAAAQNADPATRLLGDAERKVAAGDVDAAIADFEAIIAQFDGAVTLDARLELGRLLLERGDVVRAEALASEVLEVGPRLGAASGAHVLLGEAALRNAKTAEELQGAAASFARAWTLFPRSEYQGLPWRAVGRVREGETRTKLGDLAGAEVAFLDVVEGESLSRWVARAYLGLAESRAAAGAWRAAVEALQEGLARATGPAAAEMALEADVATFRRRLAAAHRLFLRDETSGPWTTAVAVPGVEFKRPIAVAAGPGGEMTVVDRGLDAVLWIGEDGSVERQAWRDTGRPFWDSEDRSWVPVGAALQTRGEAPSSIRFATGDYKNVVAGARAVFGSWLLTAKPEAVIRVSPEVREEETVRLPPRSEIADIASDLLGRPLLLDRKAGTVQRVDGQVLESLVTGLDRPTALAVGPFGHIFVLERGGRIAVFDSAGERVAGIGPNLPGGGLLQEAEDLAVDEEGRIWIADAKASAVVRVE